MQIDQHAVQEELIIVDRLIEEKCLQRMRMDRAAKLGDKGLTGCACADGWYSNATAVCCAPIHWVQHLLKLNGAGFTLGLDPMKYEGVKRQYLEAAQFALLFDLDVAYHELKKGSFVISLCHAPRCGQRILLDVDILGMLLATHHGCDVVSDRLKISHELVIPAVMVDRNYGTPEPDVSGIELYVIKHEFVRKYGK